MLNSHHALLNFYYTRLLYLHCIRSLGFAVFFHMGDHCPYNIPDGLSDVFSDSIWKRHPGPWRRHSVPAPLVHDGFIGVDSWLRETESESDRERPEWQIPWSVIHERPQSISVESSASGCSGGSTTGLFARMDSVADPYWAKRGWVLLLFIELCRDRFANLAYRRRSKSLKSRSLRQTPANSHRHSMRQKSSNN